jgi:alkylation response protein AidB-like acyl-CoA dehydrogenase
MNKKNDPGVFGRGEYGGPRSKEFVRRLGADGWLGIGWPKEYGGQGRSLMEQHIFYEIIWSERAPFPVLTLNAMGPTIMQFGTQEQKDEFLPRILQGELEIAIGYTESDAGTDLFSLTSNAVKDGDDYIINGQKVFTSLAHIADYLWLAARTDADPSKKHKGISLFLIPIDTPGIKIGPIYTLGGHRTNAIFFDNTKINGKPVIDQPGVRSKFAELLAQVEVLKLFNYNVVDNMAKGLSVWAEASAVKVFGSELNILIDNTLMEIMGPYGQIQAPDNLAPADGAPEAHHRDDLIFIFGGGANEVQRDIIAMVGLGMPPSR